MADGFSKKQKESYDGDSFVDAGVSSGFDPTLSGSLTLYPPLDFELLLLDRRISPTFITDNFH